MAQSVELQQKGKGETMLTGGFGFIKLCLEKTGWAPKKYARYIL
jgi:hypothetical protein